MRFVYHKDSGDDELLLDGQSFIHIYQSRRTDSKKPLFLRNLKDDYLHTYEALKISRKSANLKLKESKLLPLKPKTFSHLIWAITDVKTIEKTLPFLNELGLGKLTLFYADFSQKNFKPNLERLQKILISSCEQCGRSDLLNIEILSSTKEVLKSYSDALVLDFGGEILESGAKISLQNGVIIGAEGGFSQDERELFKAHRIYSFATPFILKSQTAAISVLSPL